MPKEKRPVYNGYTEEYMTGQEIIDKFSNAYECFGRHHERTSAYKMDWTYKPRVKPDKTYRLFINEDFCCILDGVTDAKLYFFGYTMDPPPWAKEGKRPPAPKYTTASIDVPMLQMVDGEVKQVPEEISIQVICDEEGNILTDLKLLRFLYIVRQTKRFPVFITNKALVSMATYMPLTKEDFISLNGIGPGIYSVCGEEFIKAIQSYIDYTEKNNKEE